MVGVADGVVEELLGDPPRAVGVAGQQDDVGDVAGLGVHVELAHAGTIRRGARRRRW